MISASSDLSMALEADTHVAHLTLVSDSHDSTCETFICQYCHLIDLPRKINSLSHALLCICSQHQASNDPENRARSLEASFILSREIIFRLMQRRHTI